MFLLFLGTYLLTSPGTVNSVDSWPPLAEAASLVELGTVRYDRLDPADVGPEELAAAVSFGRIHSELADPDLVANKYGFGLHVFQIPVYAAARLVSGATGRRPLEVAKSVAGYVSAFAAAGAMTLFAVWAARVLRGRLPVGVALLLGFGTYVWPLSGISLSDPVQMLTVAAVLLQAARAAEGARTRDLHLLGALAAWGVLCKNANVFLVAACAATALEGVSLRRLAGPALLWAAAAAAAQSGINAWRYDGAWHYPGYPIGEQFRTPLSSGVPFLLGSPERGWIWFVPVLPAALAGLAGLLRRRPRVAVPLAAGLCAHFLVQARFTQVDGGWCLGPRYLLPLTPILGLGCVAALGWIPPARRAAVLATLTAATAAWTFPMTAVAYFVLLPIQRAVVDAGGLPSREPVPVQTLRVLLAKSVRGPDEIPLAPFAREPVEGGVRFEARDAAGWQWAWVKPHPSVPGGVRWATAAAFAALAGTGGVLLASARRAGGRSEEETHPAG